MQSKSTAQQDPKRRVAIIAATSLCILIGLSFTVYSLMPGELPGAKLDAPVPVAATPAPAKPVASTSPVAPSESPQAPRLKLKGFESVGK